MKLKILSGVVILFLLSVGAFFVFKPTTTTLSQEGAGNGVIAPAWGAYRTTSLTPSSIEGRPDQNGRYVTLPYGNTVLTMGGIAKFQDLSIRPIELVEDSRCPIDVQCIQAGTVRLKIEVVSGMGTSTDVIQLNQVFTTEGKRITLFAVSPDKKSKTPITIGAYRLTFNVVQLQQ